MKRFILIGSPIAHSLSPLLHNFFAAQFKLKIQYELQEATIDTYPEILSRFICNGGDGVNITAPLKIIAVHNLKYLDKTAYYANAVNTLKIHRNGMLYGYNTDGIGLLRDLERNLVPVRNSEILILGAGGAARGILAALISKFPKKITLVNRDTNKAAQIANDFSVLKVITVVQPKDLASINANLILNTTSSLALDYIDKVNFSNAVCYDLNYTPRLTEFMKTAQNNGALYVFNGLGMLIEQAAEAFKLWHGVNPDTHKALEHLHANTGQKSLINGL